MTKSKPMRPLAAYHIFFQIEREYIIQTASPDHIASDPTKTYQAGVPSRYRSIKLSPDWYAGPGKRQKRKHRKTHGMIGFLELSRVISQRWATLETVDLETKAYVTQVAAREMVEFKEEMKEYELLTGDVMSNNCTKQPAKRKKSCTKTTAIAPGDGDVMSSNRTKPSKTKKTRTNVTAAIAPMSNVNIDTVPSSPSGDGGNIYYASVGIKSEEDLYTSPPINNTYSEVDYSIATVSNNGHYVPSFALFNDSVAFNVSHPDVDELSADPFLDWDYNMQSLITNKPKEMIDEVIDHDDDFLDFMSLSAKDEKYLSAITDDDNDTDDAKTGL